MDRGKRGAKRSLLTDGAGIPLGLAIDGANRPDFELAEGTLLSVPIPRPEPTEEAPQHLCLDKGYDYDEVYGLLHDFGYTPHVRPRGEEAQALKREAGHTARRWVAERTHTLPADPGPLGEDVGERPRLPPPRLRHDHLPRRRATGIGSKYACNASSW